MSDNRTLTTADLAGTSETKHREGSGEGKVWVPEPQKGSRKDSDESVALFHGTQAEEFRERWESIQTGFVDEPRRSVEQADNLVAEVIKTLAESFSNERSSLERQWASGGGGSNDASTEDLRVALRRYRSFFQRLLSV
jgi:hypothetical protein